MNEIPKNGFITKNGFKIQCGKYWTYYDKGFCLNCNKIIYIPKQNKSNTFCGPECTWKYYHDIRDPLGANILNQIDNPHFYYLLGLIATDGCVRFPPKVSSYNCTIGLIDVELISKLKLIFGGIIRTSHNFQWVLNNKSFIEYLVSIGITNNKTFTLDVTNWFNSLKDSFKYAFMRGVFDGDGHICKTRRGYWRVGITSASQPFTDMLANFIKNSKVYSRVNKAKKCNEISLSSAGNIEFFLDTIYNNSTLHLDRKHQLYIQFKDEQHKRQIHKKTSA